MTAEAKRREHRTAQRTSRQADGPQRQPKAAALHRKNTATVRTSASAGPPHARYRPDTHQPDAAETRRTPAAHATHATREGNARHATAPTPNTPRATPVTSTPRPASNARR